ncbi:MAG: family containing protein [Nocardioides sp.]|nr:family containing protein [Nocardioides sp.]
MSDCTVFELRQYTLKPGRTDDLVDVFDRELVHTQESVGITVVGQFRDLERPDRFVWLRGFADMAARRTALKAFYGGPDWREHGPVANDTMAAWDDVLLLAPLRPVADEGRPEQDAPHAPQHLTISVHPAGTPTADDDVMALATLHEDNTFPALPVRTDLDVVVRVRRDEEALTFETLQVVTADPTAGSRLR